MDLVDKLDDNVLTDLKTETCVLYQEPYKSESLKNHTFFSCVFPKENCQIVIPNKHSISNL